MTSPAVSRTSSAVFAPGAHRRSHLDLQNFTHLSLAPLTPKYPVEPADYSAYFDPATSELHSSASLSQIASLPSPGGILTNSPVRSRASSRKRKIKSSVKIQIPGNDEFEQQSAPRSAVHEYKPALKQKSRSHAALSPFRADPEWLTQTGLLLTEGFRESKGQSWLAKRDSSTSLAVTPVAIDAARRDFPFPRSGRTTPARSRATSRAGSRAPSRTSSTIKLNRSTSAMTAHATTTSFMTAPEPLADQIAEEFEDVEPQWVDARTQAEAAALQAEIEGEYGYCEDPYGMLDFSGQGESSDDEEEVRKAMARYGMRGLRWMDDAIDALLSLEEQHDSQTEAVEQPALRGGGVAVQDLEIETPPNDPRSYWDTAYWFGRMIKRAAAG